MLEYEVDESKRSLENKMRDIQADMVNMQSDLGKIARKREEIEINKRQIQKKIKSFKMDLEAEELKEKELDQKEFELSDQIKRRKKEEDIMRVQIQNTELVE